VANSSNDGIVPPKLPEQRVTRDGLCGTGTTSSPTVSAARMACGRLPPVSLLTELDGFYSERRRCGELDGAPRGRPRLDDVLVRRCALVRVLTFG
jgi:hypothetical protein